MFKMAQGTKVSEGAVQQIAELIRTRVYVPGDRLPSERQLSQQLGVSRTSVREALNRLGIVGLVEPRQGLGTFVKEPTSEAIQAALIPHLITNQETLQKLFELREIIEVGAANRAAQRATPSQVASMRYWVEAVELAIARNDRNSRIVADTRFHRQIIIATGNNILVDLVASVAHLLREMRYAGANIPELLPAIISGHRAILAAIEARDSQAAGQAMQNHLNSVRDTIRNSWAQQGRNKSTGSASTESHKGGLSHDC